MEPLFLAVSSGLVIGFIGSVHCLGMCGPIALTLPVFRLSRFNRFLAIFLYNMGRAMSYALLGAILGLIGTGFHFFGCQQWLSIVAGLLILVILFTGRLSMSGNKFLQPFTNSVRNKLGSLLREDKKAYSYLMIGLLNGFLPCGLVYVAVASSIATGTVQGGAMLMFAFGLGTMPVMAATMVLGRYVSARNRQLINKAAPYIIALMGVLLIVRGMNLGIPYVSPKDVSTAETTEVDCCRHK